MTDLEFFASVGAVIRNPAEYSQSYWANDPNLKLAEPVIDFGYRGPPNIESLDPPPTIAQTAAAPLVGAWDRKTSFSLFKLHEILLGKPMPAQRQTLGTCTSRGASLAANLSQLAEIAAGATWEYSPVAHAPIYGFGREIANMLAPPGRDGCYGSAVCEGMKNNGLATLKEVGDEYDSDEIAGKMGWKGVPSNIKTLCSDNKIADFVPVMSFDEAADLIVSGKPVIVCSLRGFSMKRDSDGFCAPQGTWAHCMCFGSVHVTAAGRRGLGCAQSWGQNTPSGPTLPNCPDFVFGVEERTVNEMLRQKDTFAITGKSYWARQSWPANYDLWSTP